MTGRHREGPGRRVRPWAVAATLVVGAVVLSATLRLEPGDARFVPAALALAAVWLGGALLAGTRVGWGEQGARCLGLGLAAGAVLLVLCLAAGFVIARVPALADPADELLAHAEVGGVALVLLVTVVNGVGEEMFFRGALLDALPSRVALVGATAVYALTTVGSGVALLVLAAAFLGVATALLRRRTDGLVAPVTAHLTWSVGMLLLLPHVLATGR